jgi:F0F1-type ATP synthase delta subunit
MQETLKILVPIVMAHVLGLVAIVVLIRKLLLNDTMNAVNRIRQVEAEVRQREETIKKQIDEHEKEFANRKVEAEEEMRRQREKSEKELATIRDQVLADAKKESEGIVSQAKKKEEKLRQQIMQEMEEKAVEYGGKVFQLVFSDKMNEELNRQFIDELLEALSEIDATAITVAGDEIDFTSSHEIDPEQKARIEQLLADKFGVDVKVEEKVQKDLMGGLIFKLGSLEIDGSLLNRFREASAEVKKSISI